MRWTTATRVLVVGRDPVDVDLLHRLVDQAALVLGVEHLAGHPFGGENGQLHDVATDRLAELAVLLVPALEILRGLLAPLRDLLLALAAAVVEQPLALGPGLVALLARQLAKLARLLAGLVGRVQRLADPVTPLVDQALDPAERELPQDEEDDRERDDRPDHQAGDDRDEVAAGVLLCENERVQHRLDEDVGEQTAEQGVEDDGLSERETEPLDARELAAKFGLAGDGLDHRAEDVPDADAGADGPEADADAERDRLSEVGDVSGRLCE